MGFINLLKASTFASLGLCLSAFSVKGIGILVFSWSEWCFDGQTCCKTYIIPGGDVSFMRAKYGEWSFIFISMYLQNNSHLLKKLCSFVPLILSNLRWIVGNGSYINMIRDPYISFIPIGLWSRLADIEFLQGIDLTLPNMNGWNTLMLCKYFSKTLVEQILPIPTRDADISNRLGWGPFSWLINSSCRLL